jgi:hypothetical protein
VPGAELPVVLRLLFDVPAAVAAVVAGLYVASGRDARQVPLNAGLAAAGAVLAVGGAGALLMTCRVQNPMINPEWVRG